MDPNLSAMLCQAEEEGYDAGFGEVEREGKSDDRREGGLWCYQRGLLRSKPSSERFDAYLAEGAHIMPGVDILPRFTCTVIYGDVNGGELTEHCASRGHNHRIVNAVGVSSNPCPKDAGAERIGQTQAIGKGQRVFKAQPPSACLCHAVKGVSGSSTE